MKILTIIGARPQFVKASVVSRAIAAQPSLTEIIVHTGQHFDANMSNIFFEQLGIPRPDYLLDINGGTHGAMTGRMLAEIEQVIRKEKPDVLMVYGDTNSTLAGALAAAKLHVDVCHVESGLRSYNMKMPEEINRILTDRVSRILFCPTQTAVDNLLKEGYSLESKEHTILNVGDVMQDSALLFSQSAARPEGLDVTKDFILTTIHRAENTDDKARLTNIVEALNTLHREFAPVVLPLHPRTQKLVREAGLTLDAHVIEPVGYLEMLWLIKHAGLILTDSGGLQKEAFFFGKPCVTMRDQTEWVELVTAGANILSGADRKAIIEEVQAMWGKSVTDTQSLYGGGEASRRIASHLAQYGKSTCSEDKPESAVR